MFLSIRKWHAILVRPAIVGATLLAVTVASPNAAKADNEMSELAGSWILVALDGDAPPELSRPLLLEFTSDGMVGGFSGVNRFRGTINTEELADGRIGFGQMASTMMAGPPEAMAFERRYLDRLSAVSTYVIEGDRLSLFAGDNEALTLKRRDASAMVTGMRGDQ